MIVNSSFVWNRVKTNRERMFNEVCHYININIKMLSGLTRLRYGKNSKMLKGVRETGC